MNKDSVTEAIPPILTVVQFSDRAKALRNQTKKAKEILPFVTTYNPATANLKKILMTHWHIIQQQPKLAYAFKQPPIVSYRKEKSPKDILVRAKLPNHPTIIKQRGSFKRFLFQTRRKFTYNLLLATCSANVHAIFSVTQPNT